MDLLGTPFTSTRQPGKTPFFPPKSEEWDLGPFLSYPSRVGLSQTVIPIKKVPSSSSSPNAPDINNVPLERQHAVCTTWLYIGLLAEFLGVNEVEEDGKGTKRMVTEKEAQRVLRIIYVQCVTEITNGDDDDEEEEGKDQGEGHGKKFVFRYLDGVGAFGLINDIGERLDGIGAAQREKRGDDSEKGGDDDDGKRNDKGKEGDDKDGEKLGDHNDKEEESKNLNEIMDPAERIAYLAECLRLTSEIINAAPEGFSRSLKLAICALGECLSLRLQQSKGFLGLGGSRRPQTGFSWKQKFLAQGSGARKQMLRNGWCKSDLSRAEGLYGRLQTLYYLSLMERNIAGRDHASCGEDRCVAGQIVDGTYKLSHDPEKGVSCSCEELEVDLVTVNEVLTDEGMNTFPVLSVEFPDDRDPDKVALKVGAVTEGVEYVAISHVS